MRIENKKTAPVTFKGVYVLIIEVNKDTHMNVGAKGKLTFKKGLYAYVGSAQKDLEQRVRRHLRKEKHKFWHIDYLLGDKATKVVEVFHKQADKTQECVIAKLIGEKGESITGVGSSDCSCKSHLFRIKDYEFLQESMRVLDVKTKCFLRDYSEK
jgi:Uri superfamily endonuclease